MAVENASIAMSERKQVNVKVGPETKERWKEHVEKSHEVNSMSDLIRLSVENKISEGMETTSSEGGSDHLEEISRTLNSIQSDIGTLESRMSRIEVATQEDPEVDKLANEIFPLLPDIEPGTDAWEQKRIDLHEEQQYVGSSEVRERKLGWQGTPEAIAEALEVSGLDARKALERLLSDMTSVRTVEHSGKERYWRDV